jgi:hypothetical protein
MGENKKAVIQIPSFLAEAFNDTTKLVCIKAGRRIGKTYNFVVWLLVQVINNPNSPALYVDTRHANIDKYIERYFKPILTKMNLWTDCKWNAQKKVLHLHNGSYIDFGSSERPEGMEGFGYKYALLNEAGIILKKRSLYENTLQPMLKNATVRAVGTCKGNNYFKTLCAKNKTYHFTAYDSPFWTEQEIEQAKSTMTQEAFRQEVLAEFIDGAGAVFRNIRQNISGELIQEPIQGVKYGLAVDIAKHQDFTVILVGDLDKKQVVYHERFNQIDWVLQKARIQSVYDKFKCISGIIDATGVGDSVFDDLTSKGLNIEGFKFTSSSKQELVSNLSVAMDNQEIHYPDIEPLLDELSLYAYEQRPNGQFSYSAPDGFHDDEVMSLALLNKLFNQKTVQWASATDYI